jgi:hypothetical protein
MSIDDFVRYSEVLHRLTADFVRAVPENKWDFTPDPPAKSGRAPAPHRIGDGFAPFCKQLRHVVCVRGVYNAALATRKVVDPSRSVEHLCLARRVRHAAQLANVMGLVKTGCSGGQDRALTLILLGASISNSTILFSSGTTAGEVVSCGDTTSACRPTSERSPRSSHWTAETSRFDWGLATGRRQSVTSKALPQERHYLSTRAWKSGLSGQIPHELQ